MPDYSNQTLKIGTIISNDINMNSSNVNQTGSNISTVTLPAVSGIITTQILTNGTGSNIAFTANHPQLNANKVVLSNIIGYSGAGTPHVRINNLTNGSMQFVIANSNNGAVLNAAAKISYIIL